MVRILDILPFVLWNHRVSTMTTAEHKDLAHTSWSFNVLSLIPILGTEVRTLCPNL